MNKSRELKKIPVKKTVDQGTKSISRETDAYYFLAFFFILSFSYFNWFAGYLLFFQEQQSLFMFSGQFIHDFLAKPGGLLDLSGKFLTQFYISKFPSGLSGRYPLFPALFPSYKLSLNRSLVFPVFLRSPCFFCMQTNISPDGL
jgi:hypothetical protein